MKLLKRPRFAGSLKILAVSIALFALAILPTFKSAHALGQVYLVTNTGDNNGINPAPGNGTGTLRQAIVDANANTTLLNGEPHNIQFNIPGTGVHTISLQAALPQLTQPTFIDGTTQTGSGCGTLVEQNADGTIKPTNTPHVLSVEVTSSAISGVNTLSLASTATGSVVRGLIVNGAQDSTNNFSTGISNIYVAAPNTTIECDYIGTDPTTLTRLSDKSIAGVTLSGSANGSVVQNSVVSGNGFSGVEILDGNDGSKVYKNLIGTDKTGTTAVKNFQVSSNFGIGIRLRYTTNTDIYKNIISGNTHGLCGAIGMMQECGPANNMKVRGN